MLPAVTGYLPKDFSLTRTTREYEVHARGASGHSPQSQRIENQVIEHVGIPPSQAQGPGKDGCVIGSTYYNNLTQQQRMVVNRNYIDIIMNVFDQGIKQGMSKIYFGCTAIRMQEHVVICFWDNGGGFPANMLGVQQRPADIHGQARDPNTILQGGRGIGMQRLVHDVMDEGGEVQLVNHDALNQRGAMIQIRFHAPV